MDVPTPTSTGVVVVYAVLIDSNTASVTPLVIVGTGGEAPEIAETPAVVFVVSTLAKPISNAKLVTAAGRIILAYIHGLLSAGEAALVPLSTLTPGLQPPV